VGWRTVKCAKIANSKLNVKQYTGYIVRLIVHYGVKPLPNYNYSYPGTEETEEKRSRTIQYQWGEG